MKPDRNSREYAPFRSSVYVIGITGLFLSVVVVAMYLNANHMFLPSRARDTQWTINSLLWALDFLRVLYLGYTCLGTIHIIWNVASWVHVLPSVVNMVCTGAVLWVVSTVDTVLFSEGSRHIVAFGTFVGYPLPLPITCVWNCIVATCGVRGLAYVVNVVFSPFFRSPTANIRTP